MKLHETYTPWSRDHDGVLLYLTLCRHADTRERAPLTGRTWTHTTIEMIRPQMRMLLSFQRPPSLSTKGASFRGDLPAPRPETQIGANDEV
jgi:hypothetical protein